MINILYAKNLHQNDKKDWIEITFRIVEKLFMPAGPPAGFVDQTSRWDCPPKDLNKENHAAQERHRRNNYSNFSGFRKTSHEGKATKHKHMQCWMCTPLLCNTWISAPLLSSHNGHDNHHESCKMNKSLGYLRFMFLPFIPSHGISWSIIQLPRAARSFCLCLLTWAHNNTRGYTR